MVSFFTKRGYPESLPREAIRKVRKKKREELIVDRPKTTTNRLTFPLTYNKGNKALAKIVQSHFHILSEDPIIGEAFKEPPITAWRRSTNLRDSLVRSKFGKPSNSVIGTFPCGHGNCKCCFYTSNEEHIIGPKGYFAVTRRFKCNDRNVVYAITCEKCGQVYIGQTGRNLSTRFSEHRRSVEQYHTNPIHKDKPVGLHFSEENHDVTDMRISAMYHVPDNDGMLLKEMHY